VKSEFSSLVTIHSIHPDLSTRMWYCTHTSRQICNIQCINAQPNISSKSLKCQYFCNDILIPTEQKGTPVLKLLAFKTYL
jgi:hypothetical protein